MVKVLSQSGDSLADLYDVEGSIAGIEQLETRELPIVHEMGATVFSERLSGFIRRSVTGNVAQSTSFNITMAGLPNGIFRILGLAVLVDTVGRTAFVQVALRSIVGGREIPVFVWDTDNNVTSDILIVDDDAAAAVFGYLVPGPNLLPSLGVGVGQRQRVGEEIVMRGSTSAFGAGNVELTLLVYLGLTHTGISNRGLPVPSW